MLHASTLPGASRLHPNGWRPGTRHGEPAPDFRG